MTMTAGHIWERLEAAAMTLRRLPDPPGSGPRGYGGSWPEVVREARHAYGYSGMRVRIVPSARDIELMDEAIGWLEMLSDPIDRRIVWLRAEGHRWRFVCHAAGLVRSTCHRRATAAVLTIEKRLAARRPGAGRKAKKPAPPAVLPKAESAVGGGAEPGAMRAAAGRSVEFCPALPPDAGGMPGDQCH